MKAFDHDLISVIVFDILGYTESRAGLGKSISSE